MLNLITSKRKKTALKMPRSFWFYISFTQCSFQVCISAMIVYYWHVTSTNDEEERYNPYVILCSVVPKTYRKLAQVSLVFFFTFVFYAFMDHFYDFCLDPENDGYANFQERKEQIKKKKKKQKLIRRYPHHKKPKPSVTIDWRPPLNGDYIIRENIEDLYRKKLNEYLRETSSPHKYSPRMKSSKVKRQ